MRNLRLEIAYDGTGYRGWQKQPGKPSIQGALEAAIERLTGQRAAIAGAGRTDAGVHAAGQVASFQTASLIPAENLARALNRILPHDIRILKASEVDLAFHARRSAVSKLYRYRIYRGAICPPYLARFVCHCPFQLNVQEMMRAAPALEGRHDFSSFAASDPRRRRAAGEGARQGQGSNVRNLIHSRVILNRDADLIAYDVSGNGFLYHMVRNMAGTLIEIGRGAIDPEEIPLILAARDRSKAGPTAPAGGLMLVRVHYSSRQAALGA